MFRTNWFLYSVKSRNLKKGCLTYLLQHDLNAVLVRGALLPELPAAEVVKVADGDHAGLGVPHQADVAGQGGVGSCHDARGLEFYNFVS